MPDLRAIQAAAMMHRRQVNILSGIHHFCFAWHTSSRILIHTILLRSCHTEAYKIQHVCFSDTNYHLYRAPMRLNRCVFHLCLAYLKHHVEILYLKECMKQNVQDEFRNLLHSLQSPEHKEQLNKEGLKFSS